MPYLDSELNDAAVFTLIPNSTVNGHVVECEIKKSRKTELGGEAPMANLTWQIDEGDYTGRKIKFDNVMLGGLSGEGKPMSLGQLCSFLHYTGVKWTCKSCGVEHSDRKSFYIGTKEDKEQGLKVGNYYCPDCKNPKPRIAYDTDDFMGARCGLAIGSKKQDGGDKEFNIIRGYTDLV